MPARSPIPPRSNAPRGRHARLQNEGQRQRQRGAGQLEYAPSSRVQKLAAGQGVLGPNPKKTAVPGFGAAGDAAHPRTVQEEGRARTELQGGRDGGCNVSIDAGEWKYLLVAAGPATLGTEPSFGLLVLPTARPVQPRSQGAEPCRAFRCASSAVLVSKDLVHSWSARPELAAPRRPWARRAARPCSMPPKEQVHVRRCVRTPAHVLHLPPPLARWARSLLGWDLGGCWGNRVCRIQRSLTAPWRSRTARAGSIALGGFFAATAPGKRVAACRRALAAVWTTAWHAARGPWT